MAGADPLYRPRDAEHSVLHRVITTYPDALLRAAAEAGEGDGLPQFVEANSRTS